MGALGAPQVAKQPLPKALPCSACRLAARTTVQAERPGLLGLPRGHRRHAAETFPQHGASEASEFLRPKAPRQHTMSSAARACMRCVVPKTVWRWDRWWRR